MTIPRILLCMNMLLLVTCSATESHTFKDKLRGLVAYEKADITKKYIFNANTDLTMDIQDIFYHFDSIVSSDTAYYKVADNTGFYALQIRNDEVYRSVLATSTGAINLGVLEPFLVLDNLKPITDVDIFKNKLSGLNAYQKDNPGVRYIFNDNSDLTKDGTEIVYHFDSVVSKYVAYYRNENSTGFYALQIKNNEVYRTEFPVEFASEVDMDKLKPFLVLEIPVPVLLKK